LAKRKSRADIGKQILELKAWVDALTRRIEELEATAFQLRDEEDVILIAVPKR